MHIDELTRSEVGIQVSRPMMSTDDFPVTADFGVEKSPWEHHTLESGTKTPRELEIQSPIFLHTTQHQTMTQIIEVLAHHQALGLLIRQNLEPLLIALRQPSH